MTETPCKPGPADHALYWWRDLQDTKPAKDGEGRELNPQADRAALARLRRASLAKAWADPAVIDLYRRLFGPVFYPDKMALAARLALVLVHVRKEDKAPFGQALGAGGDHAPLSPLRLRRLLQADEPEEIIRQFRRAVDLLRNTAHVRTLAVLLIGWTDPERAEQTRAGFAFAYYGAQATDGDQGKTARAQPAA